MSPETYTARTIVIYSADDKNEITRFPVNADGTYQATLPPEDYILDLVPLGIDRGQGLPYSFSIEPGEVEVFDFSIDTGVR